MLQVTKELTKLMLEECIRHAHLMHLFVNEVVDSAIEFCEPEPEHYRPCELTGDWKIKGNKVKGKPCKFILHRDCKVYGYYITSRNGQVLWYEKFPMPFECGPFFESETFIVEITPSIRFENL